MKHVLFLLPVFLLGCAGKAPVPQIPVEPDIWVKTMEIREGEIWAVPEASFQIRFDDVLEDTRCPTDVTCIQEGHVLVEFSYIMFESRQNYTFRLSSGEDCLPIYCVPFMVTGLPRNSAIDGSVYYEIRLVSVLPERLSSQEIAGPYRVKLRITN